MISNYFKVARRNLVKNRFYSAINIFGLSIGIASTLFIMAFVVDELSYDKFHANYQNKYRVQLNGKLAEQEFRTPTTPPPLSEALVNEFPEIINSTRLNFWNRTPVELGEKLFTEDVVMLADSNFFKFFDFNLLQGDPETALKGPNKVVLSETAAKKYFGDEDPIGKNLEVGTANLNCEITGVVKDAPHNSHFHYNVILSFESDTWMNNYWTSNSIYTYMELNEQVNWQETETKLDELVVKYVGPELQQYMGASIVEFREAGGRYNYFLRNLGDIHLSNDLMDEIEPAGNVAYLYTFGAIGLFIILIACINFMNLSTARSADRSKEVGIRKTVGAVRSRLIGQFLTESIIISILSGVIALGIIGALIPFFNTFTGKLLSFRFFFDPLVILAIVSITILVGVIAGSYPAFYLTGFRPSEVLKGRLKTGAKNSLVRSALVGLQFTISIVMIICTLLVYKQIDFMQQRNLGFDKENVLTVNNAFNVGENYEALKNELLSFPGIEAVSRSTDVPPHIGNTSGFKAEGAREEDQLMAVYNVDPSHQETLKFEMAEGRFFSEDFPTDTAAIVINEAAVKRFGWKEALNKKIYSSFEETGLTVIGVTRDINFESLKNEVRPLAMMYGTGGNQMSIRFGEGNVLEQVAHVEKSWNKYVEGSPFDYSFLDEDFDALFKTEQKMGEISLLFTGLAIFIACMGLFGLATYMAEQRTKEIGIRKVLGASLIDITVLLSKEFTKLVVISFIIAAPISYFMMNQWLQEFAYRVNPGILVFALAGLATIAISWITVSYQAVSAALSDPVNSLRSE